MLPNNRNPNGKRPASGPPEGAAPSRKRSKAATTAPVQTAAQPQTPEQLLAACCQTGNLGYLQYLQQYFLEQGLNLNLEYLVYFPGDKIRSLAVGNREYALSEPCLLFSTLLQEGEQFRQFGLYVIRILQKQLGNVEVAAIFFKMLVLARYDRNYASKRENLFANLTYIGQQLCIEQNIAFEHSPLPLNILYHPPTRLGMLHFIPDFRERILKNRLDTIYKECITHGDDFLHMDTTGQTVLGRAMLCLEMRQVMMDERNFLNDLQNRVLFVFGRVSGFEVDIYTFTPYKTRWLWAELAWAYQYGYRAVIDYINNSGVTLDSYDHEGRTILHMLAEQGRTATAQAIVQAFPPEEQAARCMAIDRHGKSPAQCAQDAGYQETADFFAAQVNFTVDPLAEPCADVYGQGLYDFLIHAFQHMPLWRLEEWILANLKTAIDQRQLNGQDAGPQKMRDQHLGHFLCANSDNPLVMRFLQYLSPILPEFVHLFFTELADVDPRLTVTTVPLYAALERSLPVPEFVQKDMSYVSRHYFRFLEQLIDAHLSSAIHNLMSTKARLIRYRYEELFRKKLDEGIIKRWPSHIMHTLLRHYVHAIYVNQNILWSLKLIPVLLAACGHDSEAEIPVIVKSYLKTIFDSIREQNVNVTPEFITGILLTSLYSGQSIPRCSADIRRRFNNVHLLSRFIQCFEHYGVSLGSLPWAFVTNPSLLHPSLTFLGRTARSDTLVSLMANSQLLHQWWNGNTYERIDSFRGFFSDSISPPDFPLVLHMMSFFLHSSAMEIFRDTDFKYTSNPVSRASFAEHFLHRCMRLLQIGNPRALNAQQWQTTLVINGTKNPNPQGIFLSPTQSRELIFELREGKEVILAGRFSTSALTTTIPSPTLSAILANLHVYLPLIRAAIQKNAAGILFALGEQFRILVAPKVKCPDTQRRLFYGGGAMLGALSLASKPHSQFHRLPVELLREVFTYVLGIRPPEDCEADNFLRLALLFTQLCSENWKDWEEQVKQAPSDLRAVRAPLQQLIDDTAQEAPAPLPPLRPGYFGNLVRTPRLLFLAPAAVAAGAVEGEARAVAAEAADALAVAAGAADAQAVAAAEAVDHPTAAMDCS